MRCYFRLFSLSLILLLCCSSLGFLSPPLTSRTQGSSYRVGFTTPQPASPKYSSPRGANDAVVAVQTWDRKALDDFASQQGVVLSITTLGPGFRGLARCKHNTTQILGYVEGFIRPSNTILHLDKMEVFRPIVKAARKENPEEFRGGGSIFGVGLLVGYLCLLHGMENGCSVAEFLAIDDSDYQHKRLVRYYKNVGFDVIKYVGDDWRDVPDRLVWGGCGTLFRKDIDVLMEKWTRLLSR